MTANKRFNKKKAPRSTNEIQKKTPIIYVLESAILNIITDHPSIVII